MSVILRHTNETEHLINVTKNISMDASFINDTKKQADVLLYNLSSEIYEVLGKDYLLRFRDKKNKGCSFTQWYSNQDSALEGFSDTTYPSPTHQQTDYNIIAWDKEPNQNKKEKIIFQLSENVELEVDNIHIEKIYKYDGGNIYTLKETAELPMLVLVQLKDAKEYPKLYQNLHSAKTLNHRLLGYINIELSEVGYTPNNYKELVALTRLKDVDFRKVFGIANSTFSQHQSGSRGLNWQGWGELINKVRDYLTNSLQTQIPLSDFICQHDSIFQPSEKEFNDNNERYFYITWKLNYSNSNEIQSNLITTKDGKFFNPDYVFKGFGKDKAPVVLLYWNEFKNREDYEEFSKHYT